MRRQGTKQTRTRGFPAGKGLSRQVEPGQQRRGPYDSPRPWCNVPDVQLSGVMNLSSPTVSSVTCCHTTACSQAVPCLLFLLAFFRLLSSRLRCFLHLFSSRFFSPAARRKGHFYHLAILCHSSYQMCPILDRNFHLNCQQVAFWE